MAGTVTYRLDGGYGSGHSYLGGWLISGLGRHLWHGLGRLGRSQQLKRWMGPVLKLPRKFSDIFMNPILDTLSR